MSKVKDCEPSSVALKNDRKNHLGNSQRHLHSVSAIARKFYQSGRHAITDRDINKLIDLSDKCSQTLKKYLNTRNFMRKDQMLKAIDNELGMTLPYSGFDNEIDWLGQFGEVCVDNCNRFIQNEVISSASGGILTINDLYQQIIRFREELDDLTPPLRYTDPDDIQDNIESYLQEVLKIANGTGLVCEDGLKYYGSTSNAATLKFSARSIWLGSKMYFHGTKRLLAL